MSDDDDALVLVDRHSGKEVRFDANSPHLWQVTSPRGPYFDQLSDEQKKKAQELAKQYGSSRIAINLDSGEPYANRMLNLNREDLEWLREIAEEPEAWCVSQADQEKLIWHIQKRDKELKDKEHNSPEFQRWLRNNPEAAQPTNEEQREILQHRNEFYANQDKNAKEPQAKKNDQPIRISTWEGRGAPVGFRSVSKTDNIWELKIVAYDYKNGDSYCTSTMNFDDYQKLVGWIKEKEPLRIDRQKDPWAEEYRDDDPDFEKLCRQFEEGDKILLFREGKRQTWAPEEITKDSDLQQMHNAAWRTSVDYDGGNSAAHLPEEKRLLLANWIKEKEKEAPEITYVKGLTPDSDYLKLATYLAREDKERTAEEYWTVHKWAEKQQKTFLEELEREDLKDGRVDVVRAVAFDNVQVYSKDDDLMVLHGAKQLDMSQNHKERLDQWIQEKELAPDLSTSHLTQDFDQPLKFERSYSRDEKPKKYDYLSKDNDLEQLKRVSKDYESGESYCTYNMRFDDYYRLNSWIREKEAEKKPAIMRFAEPENQHFQLICREFEEGHKIVLFPEGKRGEALSTETLTKDSDLQQLKDASRRTSEMYRGAYPVAALPPEKQELLNNLIKTKEKELRLVVPAKEFDLDDLKERINNTDWTYHDSDDARVKDQGRKQTQETHDVIREAARSNPLAMDKFLRDLEAEKWRVTNTINQIKEATAAREPEPFLDRVKLPFSPKAQSPDSISWKDKQYSKETPLQELKELLHNNLRQGQKEDRLPAEQYKKLWSWVGQKLKQEQDQPKKGDTPERTPPETTARTEKMRAKPVL